MAEVDTVVFKRLPASIVPSSKDDFIALTASAKATADEEATLTLDHLGSFPPPIDRDIKLKWVSLAIRNTTKARAAARCIVRSREAAINFVLDEQDQEFDNQYVILDPKGFELQIRLFAPQAAVRSADNNDDISYFFLFKVIK